MEPVLADDARDGAIDPFVSESGIDGAVSEGRMLRVGVGS